MYIAFFVCLGYAPCLYTFFFHPGVNVLLTKKENVSLVVDIFVAKFNSEYAVKETLQADGDNK